MTLHKFVDRSRGRDLLTGACAATSVIALIVIAYGVAKSPEQRLLATYEAAVSPRVAQAAPLQHGTSAHQPPAAPATRLAASVRRGSDLDSSRECSVDAGIVDDCIFN